MAIKEERNDVVQLIFDKIIKLIEKEDYSYMKLLPIINSNLPELCDQYSGLAMKYILRTSVLFNSSCLSIKNSTNNLLYAYSNNVYIRKSISSSNNYFKSLLSSFCKHFSRGKTPQTIPTISFIVPFSPISEKHYNFWNKILYKPKPILLCNV